MANPTKIKKHHPAKEKVAMHRAEPQRKDFAGDSPWLNALRLWKERDRLPASERITKGGKL